MNVALTLGMRAGQLAMHQLDVTRGTATRAVVQGGSFFGQGVEAVTGCSMVHGTMEFVEKPKSLTDWFVLLEANGRSVRIQVKDHLYSGADEVLSLKEEHLFEPALLSGAAGA
jgi:formylmethanofuran dehydrogenase subunit E